MVTNSQRGMSRKVTSLERENERLRELLSIARTELFNIACLMDLPLRVRLDAESAHRNSDPDASTEDVTP